VVDVGEVDSRRARLVELLSLSGDRVGKLHHVEDLGPVEAGDLQSTCTSG